MNSSVVSVDRLKDETGWQRLFSSHVFRSSSVVLAVVSVLLFFVRVKVPGVGNLPYWVLLCSAVLFLLSWGVDKPLGVWRRWPVVASSAGLRRPRGGVPARIAVYPTGISSVCLVTAQEAISEDSWRTAVPLLASGFGFERGTIQFKKHGKLVVLKMTNRPSPIDLDCERPLQCQGRSVLVGVDEHGKDFWLDAAGNSSCVVAGLPGCGKSFFLKRIALSYALNPGTHVFIFDGKQTRSFFFLSRISKNIHSYSGTPDSDDRILKVLEKLVNLLRQRASSGKVDWPLIVLIFDECQSFLSLPKGLTKEEKEARERALKIIKEFVQKGRELGFFVVLATQKLDGTAIPTSIRDLAGIRCSGKLRTRENEVMVFGENIGLTSSLSTGQMVFDNGSDISVVKVAKDPNYKVLNPT